MWVVKQVPFPITLCSSDRQTYVFIPIVVGEIGFATTQQSQLYPAQNLTSFHRKSLNFLPSAPSRGGRKRTVDHFSSRKDRPIADEFAGDCCLTSRCTEQGLPSFQVDAQKCRSVYWRHCYDFISWSFVKEWTFSKMGPRGHVLYLLPQWGETVGVTRADSRARAI